MKLKVFAITWGIGVCLVIQPVVAAQFEDGVAAFNRMEYSAAIKLWRPLAEQGDAHSQYLLGLSYENGQGVPKDYNVAATWYRLAAEQGYSKGLPEFSLGLLYMDGKIVPQDNVHAYMWFNLSAIYDGASGAASNRDLVSELMTSQEIAEAQRLTREWLLAHRSP